jgi:hypothetical protein
MPRPYSEKYLRELSKLDPERIGVQLGRICVENNLPIMYVARLFKVSRMTVHNWFRGKYVRDKNYTRIQTFIAQVKDAVTDGTLPAPSLSHARQFVDIVKLTNK